MFNNFHPGIFLIFLGIVIMLLPEKVRKLLLLVAPAISLILYFNLEQDSHLNYRISRNISLNLLEVDKLSLTFGLIFIIITIIISIYAIDIQKKYESGMSLIYAGSVVTVVFSGDMISFIIFWEMAAFSAAYLIFANGNRKSSRATLRYILMHAFGGNMLLIGFMIYMVKGGSGLPTFSNYNSIEFWFILIGVGVNAVIPPFNSWIVDAYPESTIAGAVYMGSFTTKIGIYALIRMFAGTKFLVYVGVFMAIYGISMAIIENDLRRLLCYHIISQLGYMVVSLAIGGTTGVDGATAHALNNILYKGTLLMCAGSIIKATGLRKISDLSKLEKLYQKMPITFICFLIASFAISGVPFLNGFASKSLINHATHAGQYKGVLLFLTVATVGTWISVALKVNYFVFLGKSGGKQINIKQIPITMQLAMMLGAVGCIITGVFPKLVYNLTPNLYKGNPFTIHGIIEYSSLFIAATFIFVIFKNTLKPNDNLSLDFDWIYRKGLNKVVDKLSKGVYGFMDKSLETSEKSIDILGNKFANQNRILKQSNVKILSNLGKSNEESKISSSISSAVLFVIASIVIFVCIYG